MTKYVTFFLAATALFTVSCKKNSDVPDEYVNADTVSVLKSNADFPLGVGARLELFKTDPQYVQLLTKEFDAVTFENELKHADVVSNEGSYDYTKADEFLNLAQSAGLSVFGHTLVDYKSSNAVFLRSLYKTTSEMNVLVNGELEQGSSSSFNNWVTQVDPSANASFSAETNDMHSGNRAMKVVVTNAGQYQYSVQTYSDLFQLVPGYSYTLSFYAKAATNGSRFKAIVQNQTYQEKTFFLTPQWQQYNFTFITYEAQTGIKFHFPFAGIFYLDDIKVMAPVSGVYETDAAKVDLAMKDFITKTVSRYKGKIAAWDVVNEPLEENTGAIRTNPISGNVYSDKFYFAEFLGREYIAKALQYAKAADPSALLFINEDKLESDAVKLDSMVALVNRLKAQNIPLDGIGVQMHITNRNDMAAVDRAFQQLAATGLKIRISEMDVRLNPFNATGFTPDNDLLNQQRDIYRYVIASYYKNVPAAQRYGITFWDLTDKYTWIKINQGKEDFPTLFDVQYKKKPAYYGAQLGLKNN